MPKKLSILLVNKKNRENNHDSISKNEHLHLLYYSLSLPVLPSLAFYGGISLVQPIISFVNVLPNNLFNLFVLVAMFDKL